jgi:hypothetical protein
MLNPRRSARHPKTAAVDPDQAPRNREPRKRPPNVRVVAIEDAKVAPHAL